MQRYHQKCKTQVIFCFVMIVLLLCVSVLPSFAILPPDSYGHSFIRYDSRISASAAEAIVNMFRQMDDLKYFVGARAFVLGYNSSSLNLQLYVTIDTLSLVITSDGAYEINGQVLIYRLTEYGFRYYTILSNGASVSSDDVVAFRLDSTSDIFINNNFEYGTWEVTTTLAQTIDAWDEFYTSVINYDENVNTAYDNGYANGKADERAIAEEELREAQEAYDDLYSRYDTAYEEGYAEGREYTYPIAYEEGYRQGQRDGVTEQLDVGSIISALPEGAKAIINGAFGFEIFGINVAGTLTAILVVVIVGFVVRWLLSLKS